MSRMTVFAVLCSALMLMPGLVGQSAVSPAAACDGATSRGPREPSPLGDVPQGLSATDWSSIREAHEASSYAALPVDGGYDARNAGQRWSTRFDGRGFTTTPDAGGWVWGLELRSFGRLGAECAIEGQATVNVEGARVTNAWDATLDEWYVNDSRGLEHGYTLHERPTQGGDADGPLAFTLAVRGGLRAEVAANGCDVEFVNGDGAAVLTYAGLCVFDAEGHSVSAGFEQVAEGVRLVVRDDGARYPLTIDPIAQQAYFKASNTGVSDQFGRSVSVSGDTVVVGAWQEDSDATGVDGNQIDNSAAQSGAAYVFVRNGTTWSQQAYLKASNTGAMDGFGQSVSASGDTLVVGAYLEDSNATGVDGNQGDNSATNSGAAYVFVRNGTTWSQQAYLKASNTGAMDGFGQSVSASGDTLVVGAYLEDSNATGVDGNQGDNSATNSGAAYVFVRNGTTWSQQAYFKASNTGAMDEFGWSVSVSGDTVVVGAHLEDSNATGVGGNQGDNSLLGSGAAYVFVRNGTTWSQQAYLKASNTGADDRFGFSLSASADTLVVGARNEASIATGVNGNQTDNSTTDAGAAYVFVRNGTTWSQQAYLKASNTGFADRFGWSVSVSGDTVVAGAFGESSSATGVNGNQSDNSATDSGAAYVFVRNGTTWSQQAYLKASNTNALDQFGHTVSASGDTVVVGAWGEDSNATGVNGNQSDNSASLSGAAYVIDLDLDAWTDLGLGLAGVSGIPGLVGTGTLLAGSPGTLTLNDAAPSALSMLFTSVASTPLPFKCGTLVPLPILLQLSFFTDGSGTIPLAWTNWTAGLSGSSLYFQFAIQDAAAVCGVALSNAVRADVP